MRIEKWHSSDYKPAKIKSEYKYVYLVEHKKTNQIFYKSNMYGLTKSMYDNPKEAAIAVDRYLISKGKQPINVLIKKP